MNLIVPKTRDGGQMPDTASTIMPTGGPIGRARETNLFDIMRIAAASMRLLALTGLHIADSFDYLLSISEQAFPREHPVFQWGSQIFQTMAALRASTDHYGDANQLVRLCVPCEPLDIEPFVGRGEVDRPFLSIVMRTQGNRIDSLTEVLTCLAGQSLPDFEVLLLGHKLDAPHTADVARVVADQPAWLRDKIRFIAVDRGGRTAPLNVGFTAANGEYIVILDDDDTVLGHWVETFKKLAGSAPGRILRTVSVIQTISRITCRGRSGLRAESKFDRPYLEEFDWFATLRVNHSPNMTLAFPRGVFHQLGIRFDEDLTTTEDWDFLLRCAALVGVVSAPDITAIYRFWNGAPSSATLHPQSEWEENYKRITDRIDTLPTILWPVGSTKRVRDMLGKVYAPDAVPGVSTVLDADRVAALRDVVNIYHSTSWAITAPIRMLGRLTGKPRPELDQIWWLSTFDLKKNGDLPARVQFLALDGTAAMAGPVRIRLRHVGDDRRCQATVDCEGVAVRPRETATHNKAPVRAECP